MKILVTGGAGYIGSILVPELLRAGHLVSVVDNFMYNQSSLLDYCYSSNLEIIRKDITDLLAMQAIYKKDWDLIIPLACLTGAPLTNFAKSQAINVGQEAIFKMLSYINKETKIIYPTTNSGYGIGTSQECTEESPLNPISLYGRIKCNAEEQIISRGNAISFRLATAFGVSPRMRIDLLVNDFVYRAVNDGFVVLFEGHFRRNFIHVRDIAYAFLHAIKNWETMKNNIYNLGLSSANVSKMQLCEKIEEHIPNFYFVEASIGQDPDKRDYVVSNKKLENTGWKALFTLDDGIEELIKAYKIIKRNQHANI